MLNKKNRNYILAVILLMAAFFIFGVYLVARKSKSAVRERDQKHWGLVPQSALPNDVSTAQAVETSGEPQSTEGQISIANSKDSSMPAGACMRELDRLNIDVRITWRPQLESLIGLWFFDNKDIKLPAEQAESSIPGKFLLGLAKGGLLTMKAATESDDEAVRLLREVHEADPENSAPYLFISIIEKRRGNTESSERYYQAAKKGSYFNSYIPDIGRAVYRMAKTPHELLEAFGLMASVEIPDYGALKNFMMDRKDPFFARQLTQNFFKAKNLIVGADWVPMEYFTGYDILKKLDEPLTGLTEPKKALRAQTDPVGNLVDRVLSYGFNEPCKLEEFYPVLKELERRYGQ